MLSRIMSTGCLKAVLDLGIDSTDFLTPQYRAMWDIILEESNGTFCSQTGGVIGPNLAKQKFPHFEFVDDQHASLGQICTTLRKARVTKELETLAKGINNRCVVSPEDAIAEARKRLDDLEALVSLRTPHLSLLDGVHRTLQRHDDIAAGKAVGKVTWPWPSLQRATLGLQSDDYFCIYGRPKSKKTFVLSKCIAHAYLQGYNNERGLRVLVYTKEMTPENMVLRIFAHLSGSAYDELRGGRLTAAQRDILTSWPQFIQEHNAMYGADLRILNGKDVGRGKKDTVAWLVREAEIFRADLVVIDGYYLMSSGLSSKNASSVDHLQQLSRDGRQAQLDMGIPWLFTWQANREASKSGNADLIELYGSDALSQDVTGGMRVVNEKGTNTVALLMAGAREFSLEGLRIGGVPCTDFEEKEVLESAEIAATKKADDEEAEEDRVASEETQRKGRVRKRKSANADDAPSSAPPKKDYLDGLPF